MLTREDMINQKVHWPCRLTVGLKSPRGDKHGHLGRLLIQLVWSLRRGVQGGSSSHYLWVSSLKPVSWSKHGLVTLSACVHMHACTHTHTHTHTQLNPEGQQWTLLAQGQELILSGTFVRISHSACQYCLGSYISCRRNAMPAQQK